ncbi:MAG: FtsX-like permease family protein [Bdellovibrionota bacterium]|nr:MAG: ABC transporter permease [Pseudomonadota bacterium]
MLSLKLAARSVLRNWRHSAASVMSISLGFLAISAIQGYYVDCLHQFKFSHVNRTMTGHVIVDRRSDKPESTLLTQEEIAAVNDVLAQYSEEVTHKIRFLAVEGIIAGSGSSYAYAGYGYDVQEGEIVRGKDWAWNAIYGHPLDGKGQSQIAVGAGLAELLGCKLEGLSPLLNSDGSFKPNPVDLDCFKQSFQLTALTEKNQMNAADAAIHGIVDGGVRELEDSWIQMPLEQAQILSNTKKLSMIGIHLKDETRRYEIRDALREGLKEKFPAVTIDQWEDHPHAEIYRTMMAMMLVLQGFMLSVVAVVSALSMINTVTRSIDERQSEIGTLRAVGYENGFVIRLFAWEGGVLGLSGSIMGTLATYGVSKALDAAEILYHPALISQKVPLRIAFIPNFYALLTIVLIAGASITAMVVARYKISKDISAILRHEA